MIAGMKRREFIMLLGGAAAWPLAAHAQQPTGVRRVGVLLVFQEGNPAARAQLTALREALTKLGWTEDKNIKFEYRWVGNDTSFIQRGAQELVALQPDLIISAASSPATAALRQQTRDIPIVFVSISDPIGEGFVASFSRPGGNVTGLNFESSMTGKAPFRSFSLVERTRWLDVCRRVLVAYACVVAGIGLHAGPDSELQSRPMRMIPAEANWIVAASPNDQT